MSANVRFLMLFFWCGWYCIQIWEQHDWA